VAVSNWGDVGISSFYPGVQSDTGYQYDIRDAIHALVPFIDIGDKISKNCGYVHKMCCNMSLSLRSWSDDLFYLAGLCKVPDVLHLQGQVAYQTLYVPVHLYTD
jgi:hypothetical protein